MASVSFGHVSSGVIWWAIHLSIIWSMLQLSQAGEAIHGKPLTIRFAYSLLLHAPRRVKVIAISFAFTILSWAWVRSSDPGRAECQKLQQGYSIHHISRTLGSADGGTSVVKNQNHRSISSVNTNVSARQDEDATDLELQALIEADEAEPGWTSKPCAICSIGPQDWRTKHCLTVSFHLHTDMCRHHTSMCRQTSASSRPFI